MNILQSASTAAILLAMGATPAFAEGPLVGPSAVPPVAAGLEEPTTVETVIVTASRNRDDPRVVADARALLARTPGAVAAVANETYENRTAQGVSDLLAEVPGVLAQKRYGEESRLSIRGSGLSQGFHQRGVLIAQDGVSFADADGFSDFQGVDPLAARYIEVYRGGNALRFGGAQLGGAVNLVTPTGRTAESEYLLRLEGGSFGTLRGQASAAREFGDWDLYANASALRSDGYRQQSEQDQVRATLNLGRSFGEDREVRLIVYGADIAQEVPGSLTLSDALRTPKKSPPVNILNDYARDLTLGRVTLQSRWRLNESLVFEGGVYATAKDLYHPIYQVIDQDSRTQGAFGRFDWTGEVAGLQADLYFGFSYRQGEVEALQFVNVGGRRGAQTSDAVQEASGLDLFVEGRLFVTESLAVVAGGSWGQARRDYVRHALPGGAPAFTASRDFDWFAPRIGLLWQAEDRGPQVYANLTRSVEPPAFGALVQGANPAFVPVEPQEAWTAEIGTRGRAGALTWDVAAYRAELDGEMLNFLIGPGIPAATFNADRTVHQGIEAALDWRLPVAPAGGKLLLRQVYTFSDFRFDGDATWGDNRLPVAPQHAYRVSLKYSHPAGWFVMPTVDFRGDVFADYANTLEAPGATLLSLNAGWDVGSGVSLFLDARNLTDERWIADLSAITDARLPTVSKAVFHPGEGRSAFVGVRRRF